MRDNPIQFAVVREDPLIEAKLIKDFNLNEILLVCSGGCTVLSLQALFPDLKISAFDLNPAQIQLTKDKIKHLNDNQFNLIFNIEHKNAAGLNQCGNFESLFKGLREFIYDFILDEDSFKKLFESSETIKSASDSLLSHRYWPVAFSLFFSDALLETMFGTAAIQHAPKSSYPRYFQSVFEKGFKRKDAWQNYFLHHVFLGAYINQPQMLPVYLASPARKYNIEFLLGPLDAVKNLEKFQLIHLSNIMDWMSEKENKEIANHISKNTKKGTIVLIRQLNNEQPVHEYFPEFESLPTVEQQLLELDRSLFYSSICCLRRK